MFAASARTRTVRPGWVELEIEDGEEIIVPDEEDPALDAAIDPAVDPVE